ncbi:MAG: VOC family protein [Pseudomonadota bacterium]
MENPSVISHISIGTNDLDRAAAFYDAVLATVGARRMIEHAEAIAWGKAFPEFWVNTPYDDEPSTVGNGTHVAFSARSREEVDAFHAAALAHGGTDNGSPGGRPEYGAPFYGCFALDPDGHKIEATFWDTELTGKA